MKMFLKTWAPCQNITHNNMDSWPPLVGISLQESSPLQSPSSLT